MINSLSLRSNYKTLKKFTYLNQASLGLVSEKTVTSMIEFLNEIAKHGNAHMSDQDEVNFFQTLRNTCCRLFNCNSRNYTCICSIIRNSVKNCSHLSCIFILSKNTSI